MKLGNVCEQDRADLAASTQAAIVDVLVRKSVAALEREPVSSGWWWPVASARISELRERLRAALGRVGARVHYPALALCTDNGAMIALAAAMRLERASRTPGAAASRCDRAGRSRRCEGADEERSVAGL